VNVFLAANQQQMLRGDLIIRLVQRSDLAPVPRTVELSVQIADGLDAKLIEGASFWTGRENLEYQIIKVVKHQASAFVQGSRQMAAMTAYAYLASCVQIGYRRPNAVIMEGATFGQAFRACGATAQIGNDFPVARFSCLKGQIPSFELARALQEECGCLVVKNGQLMITRLTELFNQTPVAAMADTDTGQNSEFMERHEIPSFYTISDAGQFVGGNLNDVRAVSFVPWQDQRTLWNLSRVLVQRKKIPSSLASDLSAGDLITVGSINHAIITVVNDFRQDGGKTMSDSTIYAGVLTT